MRCAFAFASAKPGVSKRASTTTFDALFVVDTRRVGPQRILRVHDCGQFGDLDIHALGKVLRLGARRRNDCGDRFAHEAHHVLGEDGLLDGLIIELVQHGPDRPHAFEVLGEHDPCTGRAR